MLKCSNHEGHWQVHADVPLRIYVQAAAAMFPGAGSDRRTGSMMHDFHTCHMLPAMLMWQNVTTPPTGLEHGMRPAHCDLVANSRARVGARQWCTEMSMMAVGCRITAWSWHWTPSSSGVLLLLCQTTRRPPVLSLSSLQLSMSTVQLAHSSAMRCAAVSAYLPS